jgi:uncharacterized membrane protein
LRRGVFVYCVEHSSYSRACATELILWLRTAKSLSDPKIWYEINRLSGIDLLLAGALISLGSVAMLFLGQGLQPQQVVLVLLLLMVFTLSGAALHGYMVLRRM